MKLWDPEWEYTSQVPGILKKTTENTDWWIEDELSHLIKATKHGFEQ